MYGVFSDGLVENEVYYILAAPSSYSEGYITLEEFSTLIAAEARKRTIEYDCERYGISEYLKNVKVSELKIFKHIVKHTYIEQK